ncbi:MAG: NnrS family protein [Alphaproteobacteria bacterium]|nr:NnrS family protein [Alphaproteobacteria bacterium]
MIRFAHGRGMDLVLIAEMPLVLGQARAETCLPLSELRQSLETRFTLVPVSDSTGGPARYARVAETGGRLGFITPLSCKFLHRLQPCPARCQGPAFHLHGPRGIERLAAGPRLRRCSAPRKRHPCRHRSQTKGAHVRHGSWPRFRDHPHHVRTWRLIALPQHHAQSRGVQRPPASRLVVLDRGFRLFFLAAAVWAALLMVLFVLMWAGIDIAAPALSIIDWHAHELLFGYTGAVIAGFLLTAIPNWTKRYPVSGWRLAVLFSIWLAGRVAMAWSEPLGPWPAAIIELCYPLGLAFVIAREIIAGKNYRNLRVLLLVGLFALADALFLYEAFAFGAADIARRGAVSVIVLLIMLVGGRVVPSFTRNWLAQHKLKSVPVPFNQFDAATMAISALALALWTALPDATWTGIALIFAGLANAIRLFRWKGWLTFTEQLVLILHVAFAFVPLGLVATGLSSLFPDTVPPNAALHLLTAGAIGLMTIAMMTRVSLGHTGGVLHADTLIRAIYGSLVGSVLMRFAYGYAYETALLYLSASFWVLGFVLFLFRYRYMASALNDPAFTARPDP